MLNFNTPKVRFPSNSFFTVLNSNTLFDIDLKITAKLLPSGSNDSLIFPRVPDTYHIHHPVYTHQEVESIMVVHSERKTMTDKVASFLVSMAR